MCTHEPKVARMSSGERLCASCAVEVEREYMYCTGKTVLYMHDGFVVNFTGDLKYRLLRTKKSIAIVFGVYSTLRFDAWFVGDDGFIWHAVNVGDTELAHCKRTKQKVS